MNLYVATTNPGKLRDFQAAAEQSDGVRIEPLPGLQGIVPPEETGETFEATAAARSAGSASSATKTAPPSKRKAGSSPRTSARSTAVTPS